MAGQGHRESSRAQAADHRVEVRPAGGVSETNFLAYNIAMAGLGIGSLFFCVALYSSRLAPRFLAVWGVVGYASFAAGCFLELAGVAGAGLVSAAPGGLFEIFFAIWLIVRGFGSTTAVMVTARA